MVNSFVPFVTDSLVGLLKDNSSNAAMEGTYAGAVKQWMCLPGFRVYGPQVKLLGPERSYVQDHKLLVIPALVGAASGVLPESWQDIDALHMATALGRLDPTCSGYLDWRQLLLALAAAAIPAIQAAGPAQVSGLPGCSSVSDN